MKITIDTKEDSPEDIEKVIKLLHELRGGVSNSPSAFNELSEEASSGFVNMFGSSETKEEEKKEDTPDVELMSY